MSDDTVESSVANRRFKHFAMHGECSNCGSRETMYVGNELVDEKCCSCGIIIRGGYLAE